MNYLGETGFMYLPGYITNVVSVMMMMVVMVMMMVVIIHFFVLLRRCIQRHEHVHHTIGIVNSLTIECGFFTVH